ncbi:MAG: hypothetical protein IT195_13660, partial [Microthrixaceae bacterium]|nr:hypothetical protein [Microthrixaceae bacterium]
ENTMKRSGYISAAVVALAALALLSCRQSRTRTTDISVPGMSDAMAVRIVTNAALNEVIGEYDGTQHEVEVDLLRHIVLYHESQRVTSPAYQKDILKSLKAVGFDATVVRAGLNPSPPVPTVQGAFSVWPSRHTAEISIPGMKTRRDANVVVGAIGYARIGGDHPAVIADTAKRILHVGYESMNTAVKNIEVAIACSGFDANTIPALLGAEDAPQNGWRPVTL